MKTQNTQDKATARPLFQSKADAEAHAASQCASFWLKSADDIIARGLNPAKLSGAGGYDLARSEADRRIYGRFKLDPATVQRLAVAEAVRVIEFGLYPKVAIHFRI